MECANVSLNHESTHTFRLILTFPTLVNHLPIFFRRKQFSLQTHLKCNFRNLTYWECEDDVEKFICVFSFLLYILCVSSQSVVSEERSREWTYFNLTAPCSALQFSERTTWEKCKESSSRTIKQGWSSPAAWCHTLTPY